jgi:hypothetical protein
MYVLGAKRGNFERLETGLPIFQTFSVRVPFFQKSLRSVPLFLTCSLDTFQRVVNPMQSN